MATEVEGMLPSTLNSLLKTSKVLVVGAGGIGCELLKNLVLTGFHNIHIIDLDTIEVSNLNRQFLFRREHVGKPKSIVAKETALQFNPNVEITAYHDSITESKYDVKFYSQFQLVLNALDNRQARSHVNRMCLAADIPLVESGSSGYNGHVKLHKKGISECFDCTPRPHQKTFPGCTIRNTPSEPIHCIVWAKHLFNQLFGLADPDEDVSPDSADPEAIGDAGRAALESSNNPKSNVSTRQWVKDVSYDPQKLFRKFFNEDIKYLLSMQNLWAKRRPPTPLEWDHLPDAVAGSSSSVLETGLKDQRVWSIAECAQVFSTCVNKLKSLLEKSDEGHLIWDKDDDISMDFVTACANIRCYIFQIQQKSRFDIKSMAGNIIPAIASTNAIVAGLIVMMAFKVLKEELHNCHTLYVSNRVNTRKELFALDRIVGPNPKCYVCTDKPELIVKIDVNKMTVRTLGEKVLKKELNMIAPDVEIDDGQGTILISSEEGETDDIADKLLKEFNIKDGTRLKVDDFLQNYNLNITIVEMSSEEAESREKATGASEMFEIVGDLSKLHPKEEDTKVNGNGALNGTGNGESSGEPSTSKKHIVKNVDDDDDEPDLVLIEPTATDEDADEEAPTIIGTSPSKSKRSLPDLIALPAKKRRLEESTQPTQMELDETEVIDID